MARRQRLVCRILSSSLALPNGSRCIASVYAPPGVALLIDDVTDFRVAAVVMLVGTIGIATQLVRTRCLSDVGSAAVVPSGVPKPSLLYTVNR